MSATFIEANAAPPQASPARLVALHPNTGIPRILCHASHRKHDTLNPGLSELGGFRRLCVVGGMVLLGLAVVMFIARLAGMLPQGFLAAAGDSGLRPLASLAVGGCLGIAIGFWGK